MGSRRVRARAAVGALIIVILAAVVVVTTTRAHARRGSSAGSAAVPAQRPRLIRSHPVAVPLVKAMPLTPQTVGLPAGHGPRAAATVGLPQAPVAGWRAVYAEAFPRPEWTAPGGFAGCAWHGTVLTSTCSRLPSAARARWFAFPDGSTSSMSEGVFEPSRVLSIGAAGMRFQLPGSAQDLELAGAVPKIGVGASNALTSALYVVRFRAERVAGYDFVFNLWPPDNDISRSGYIQFPTGSMADDIQALVYDPGHRRPPGSVYDPFHPLASDWDSGTAFAGWHTAVIERTRARIEFFLDGRPIGVDDQAVPTAPLMLMLQTTPQVDQARTLTGGHIDVSWLKVYVPKAGARA